MGLDYGSRIPENNKSEDDKINNGLDFGNRKFKPEQSNLSSLLSGEIRGLDLSKYEEYVPEGITSQEGLEKTRALRQSSGEQFSRAVGTGLGGGLLTAVEDIGYLTDVEDWVNVNDELDNWLSEWARDQKEDLSKEFAIYKEDPNATFDPSDPASYAEAAKGLLESAVGFGITGAASGAVIGRAAGALVNTIKGTEKGAQLIARLGTTGAMNYAESRMMGVELHKNIMNEAIKNGVDYKVAKKEADEKVRQFIWANKATAIADYVALGSIFKSNYFTKGVEEQTRRSIAKNLLTEAGSEYAEEVGAGAIQKEVERSGLINLDVKSEDNSTMFGRALQYAASPQGLLEGALGAIGGPLQSLGVKGAGKLTEAITNRNIDPSQDVATRSIENIQNDLSETIKNSAENIVKKVQAFQEGDMKTVADIESQEFEVLALKHFKGNSINKLKSALNEIVSNEESDTYAKEKATEYLTKLPAMENKYNDLLNKHRKLGGKAVEQVFLYGMRKDYAYSQVERLNNEITNKQGELFNKATNLGIDVNPTQINDIIRLQEELKSIDKLTKKLETNEIVDPSILLSYKQQITNRLEDLQQDVTGLKSVSKDIKSLDEYNELIDLYKDKSNTVATMNLYDHLYKKASDPKYHKQVRQNKVDFLKDQINESTDIESINQIAAYSSNIEGIKTKDIKEIEKLAEQKTKSLLDEFDKEEKKVETTKKRNEELTNLRTRLNENIDRLKSEKLMSNLSGTYYDNRTPETIQKDIDRYDKVVKDITNRLNKEVKDDNQPISTKSQQPSKFTNDVETNNLISTETDIKNSENTELYTDVKATDEFNEEEVIARVGRVDMNPSTESDIDYNAVDNELQSNFDKATSILYVYRDKDTGKLLPISDDLKVMKSWIENTTIAKSGTEIRFEINDSDKQFAKKSYEAFKDGTILNNENLISDLPIRIYAYTKQGKKLQYNDKEVFGFLKTGDSDVRKEIVELLLKGDIPKSSVTKVTKGSYELMSEEVLDTFKKGENESNNLYDIYLQSQGKELKMYISDRDGDLISSPNTFTDGVINKNKSEEFPNSSYTPGFAYAILKSSEEIDGKRALTPHRLNVRKLTNKEANAAYKIIEDILVNNKSFKDIVDNEYMSGLSYRQALDLLAYEGMDSLINSEYSLYVKNNANTKDELPLGLHFGKDRIHITPSNIKSRRVDILEYLKTMPSPIDVRYINKTFKSSGFDDDFNWFDLPIEYNMSYNKFLFDTNKSYTNTIIDPETGALERNGFIRFGKIDSISNKTSAEQIGKTKSQEQVTKAVKEDTAQKVSDSIADKTESKTSTEQEIKNAGKKPSIVIGRERVVESGTKLEEKVEDTLPSDVVEKEVKEEPKQEPSNKKTYTRRGKGDRKDLSKGLLSEYKGLKSDIDIESESKWLKDNLPYTNARIIKGLLQIPGHKLAEGSFYNGLITLSTRATKGTAYHEGWHVVSQMYLNEEQRQILYDKWRKENNSELDNNIVEEKIAEEFRQYMINQGELKVPSWIKWLYDAILDLVNLFRTSKRKIFSDIRTGRYDYAPTSMGEAQLLSELEDISEISESTIVDAVDAVNYMIAEQTGLLNFDKENVKLYDVETLYDDIYDEFITMYESSENDEVFSNILDNYDTIVEMSKNKLSTLGLVERENKDKDDRDYKPEAEGEDIKGDDSYIKTAFEFDTKDNATGNVKLLLSFIPNKEGEKNSLGFYKFYPLSHTYSVMASNLAGIVSQPGDDVFKLMYNKLDELKDSHAFVRNILNKFETMDQYKKTQFTNAFSIDNILYLAINGKKEDDGNTEWDFINASATGVDSRFREDWNKAFEFKFINDSNTISDQNKENIAGVIDTFKSIRQRSLNNEILDKDVITNIVKLFNVLGIASTEKGMTDYFKSNKTTKEALTNLSYFIDTKYSNGLNNTLSDLLKPNFVWDYKDNIFQTNDAYSKVIRFLAKKEADNSFIQGDGRVLGPDGNIYYDKSLYSYMTKNLNLLKSDNSYINNLLESTYHSHSQWLKWASIDGNIHNMKAHIHLINKLDGDEKDPGDKSVNLPELDDLAERINTTMNGYYSPLTFADKPTGYYISGVDMTKFGKIRFENGNYIVPKLVLETFNDYFNAEYFRIIDVLNSDKKSGPNDLKHHMFPDLSPDTELAKQLDLYEKGSDNKYTAKLDLLKNDTFKTFLYDNITSNIKALNRYVSDEGMLYRDSNKQLRLAGVSNKLQNYNDSKNNYRDINELLSNFWYHSFIANVETMMMFGGDPAFYKDISKRIPEIISSGQQLRIYKDGKQEVKENFNVAVIKDIETMDEEFIENNTIKLVELYSKTMSKEVAQKKADDTLSLYKKINQADAQCYITLDRFREIQLGLGNWSDRYESSYIKLMNGEEVDYTDLLKMQALKGTHYELRKATDGSNRMIPTFLKYSQAVLFPQLVKGTKLENVYNQMLIDKVDELVFESGIKAGGIESEFGNIEDVMDNGVVKGKLKSFQLKNYYWKLQVDNPSKYNKKQKAQAGSQVKKNILANINPFSNNYKIYDTEVSGQKIIDGTISTEKALVELGIKELLNKWGIKQFEDGSVHANSLDFIYDSLLEKAYKDEMPINYIQQLKNRVPLDAIFQVRDKVEQELLAAITSAVKFDIPGAAFIQMSNAGAVKLISQEEILFNNLIASEDVQMLDEQGNKC